MWAQGENWARKEYEQIRLPGCYFVDPCWVNERNKRDQVRYLEAARAGIALQCQASPARVGDGVAWYRENA